MAIWDGDFKKKIGTKSDLLKSGFSAAEFHRGISRF